MKKFIAYAVLGFMMVAVQAGAWWTPEPGAGGGAGDLLADGTVPLTANWDVGSYTITALKFTSDQATGTAPFTVASTTEVANLKAATATALAANGGNCGAGEYPLGVDASGAVENCTDAGTEIGTSIDAIVYTKCAFVESLTAADDNVDLGMFPAAVTITSFAVHCAGTCTTGADITFEDRGGNAMAGGPAAHSTGGDASVFTPTSGANTELAVGEGYRFDVDNSVDPETDDYTICISYTVD